MSQIHNIWEPFVVKERPVKCLDKFGKKVTFVYLFKFNKYEIYHFS